LPGMQRRGAGEESAAEHVFVRIRTDEGIMGIAEAPARPQIYGETQQSIVGGHRNSVCSLSVRIRSI
jgi:L-alanine-DL-glutamate epimerase-like enolase superfamily enzyme